MPSPDPGGGFTSVLTAVSAVSPDDVWAVGYYFDEATQFPAQGQTLALHWDGVAWSQVATPNLPDLKENHLHAVSASSSTDAWAVGVHYQRDEWFPLSLHWDGSTWTAVKSRIKHTDQDMFNAVQDFSPTNAWAMGTRAALSERWNGAKWLQAHTPDFGEVVSLSGVSSNDMWAAEAQSLAHFNGNKWKTAKDHVLYLSAVDAYAPDMAVAVGRNQAETWNGTRWTRVTTSDPAASLSAVSLDSATDGWAVGTDGSSTVMEHWNGSDFS